MGGPRGVELGEAQRARTEQDPERRALPARPDGKTADPTDPDCVIAISLVLDVTRVGTAVGRFGRGDRRDGQGCVASFGQASMHTGTSLTRVVTLAARCGRALRGRHIVAMDRGARRGP